jgi:hypothetical protein
VLNFLLSANQVLGLNWQPIFDHLKTLNSKSFTTSPLQITPIMSPLREAMIGAIYSLGIPSFEK